MFRLFFPRLALVTIRVRRLRLRGFLRLTRETAQVRDLQPAANLPSQALELGRGGSQIAQRVPSGKSVGNGKTIFISRNVAPTTIPWAMLVRAEHRRDGAKPFKTNTNLNPKLNNRIAVSNRAIGLPQDTLARGESRSGVLPASAQNC